MQRTARCPDPASRAGGSGADRCGTRNSPNSGHLLVRDAADPVPGTGDGVVIGWIRESIAVVIRGNRDRARSSQSKCRGLTRGGAPPMPRKVDRVEIGEVDPSIAVVV